MKILLVENEEYVNKSATAFLIKLEYHVDACIDDGEACYIIAHDIFILDTYNTHEWRHKFG